MGAAASGVFQIVNAAGEIETVDAFAFEAFRRAEALITDAALAEMAPASSLAVARAARPPAVAPMGMAPGTTRSPRPSFATGAARCCGRQRADGR